MLKEEADAEQAAQRAFNVLLFKAESL